jgi:Zn-dependent metalloprotease
MLRFFTLFTALLGLLSLQAQVYEGAQARKRLKESQLVRVNPTNGNVQYALLADNILIRESEVVAYLEGIYKFRQPYKLELQKTEKDDIGFEHLRFRQTYKGIPLLGGMLIAHIRNGRLESFNGEVFQVEASVVSIPESVCLEHALDSVRAKTYMWQVPAEEEVIKEIRQDRQATWFPKGELMYCPVNLDFRQTKWVLAYKFNIHGSEPRTAENIYVSTVTGQVVARENLLHTADVPGKASTRYSGTQKIITDSTSPTNFRLRENTKGGGVYTYNMRRGSNYGLAVDFTDSNNIWNNINVNKDEIATDAHWGAETTYDYFKIRHGRNGFNNSNARIYSYVHYSTNYDNAFWDGVRMTYGDGSSFKPLTSLDVCGHEITHAITTYSAGLIYSNESGQLNESFSDIFGNAIERYGKPANYSWIIGEEITNDGTGLRNMSNPKLKGNPRCYKSTYWYFGTGDNGGVHYNSGVQNWWFYLISEGGSGVNDVSNTYKVDSLGILNAEKIAYRNLTVYLTPSSEYADARFYSIRAAADLYGSCSKQVVAVTNAWYACNVGKAYDSGYVKAVFIADTVVCSTSKLVKFSNLSSNASACLWDFGDGGQSTLTNPSHTYSKYGKYTIRLLVTSCHKNNKDSLTKTAYVVIDSAMDICNAVLLPSGGSDSTHKCQTFVYDEGGENDYANLKTTLYRLSAPGADSIRIRFLDFDYEFGYDSLYIYRGKFPGGTLIGAYTGSSLPFGGLSVAYKTSIITLRHVADPGVTGRGFKLYYQAIKKPVDVSAFSDTTICRGSSVLLYAKGTGGYKNDYLYQWQNIAYDDSVIVSPKAETVYKVYLTDVCTKSRDSAQVTVKVREALDIALIRDSTICKGQSVSLQTVAKGGKSTTYKYTWDQGLGNSSSHLVTPLTTTIYRVILTDNCTPLADTAFVTISVRNPLSVKLSTADTSVCYNKSVSLSASGSGGSATSYSYTWNRGLGTGNNKSTNLNAGAYIRVTLTDGCTVKPASDSVFIKVKPQLVVQLPNDTTICQGNRLPILPVVNGGNVPAYSYTWSQGLPSKASQNVGPGSKTVYVLTVNDLCSDAAKDSMTVDVLPVLQLSGLRDTTICSGGSVKLGVIASGGNSVSRQVSWDHGLGNKMTYTVTPNSTTVYQVVLSDGCSMLNDTAYATVTVKNPLSANIVSADTLVCYNKSTKLTVSGKGGDSISYTFTWNNGLGKGLNKTITLLKSAWIGVSLSDGCSVKGAEDSIWIQVREPLRVSLGNDTLICKGSDIVLESQVTGGDTSAYRYAWTPALSSFVSKQVRGLSKTTYTLTVNDQCSDAASDSVTVDVMPELRISGLRDTTICFGGVATFAPVISGGIPNQYKYTWNNGLGTRKDAFVNPVSTTVYRLDLRDNCTVPAAYANVTVNVRAPLSIDYSVSKTAICYGDSSLIQVVLKGGVPANYKWTLDGVDQTGSQVYVKPASFRNYTIYYSDRCSPDADTVFSVVVNPLPKIDFIADRVSICSGQVVNFTNLTTGAVSYEWLFGTSDFSTEMSPSHRLMSAGVFPVSLKAVSSDQCVAELTKPAYIDVLKMPESDFTFDAVSVTYDHPLVAFSNISRDYSQFTWYYGDGEQESAIKDPSHMFGDTGHFNVMLVVSNSIGCRDTLIRQITVNDIYRVFIPTAISVNDDGINDDLKVGGRGIMNYRIRIFNRWGEMIFNGTEKDKAFNGKDDKDRNLPKGSYMLSAEIRDHLGKVHYIRQVLQVL